MDCSPGWFCIEAGSTGSACPHPPPPTASELPEPQALTRQPAPSGPTAALPSRPRCGKMMRFRQEGVTMSKRGRKRRDRRKKAANHGKRPNA
ncbi:hypothetical protein GCM10022261_15830 [Brevibacterium daeguense]|uniref:Uncharacterized protein n=1 Tax=Brevibacterium daeguense TaxID=909936 RepID=A0ABP8EJE4_9MICO